MGRPDLELARSALQFGMRGFALEDHDALTTGRAYHVRRAFPELEAIGMIVLNRSVGGIDPHVVQAAIHQGARVVSMPSNHSRWQAEYFEGRFEYPQFGRVRAQLPGDGLTVRGPDGELTAEARRIVELAAAADVCLATGHLSLDEIRLLLAEARRRGLRRFLVTHANWALCRLDLEVQKELIEAGAFLEYEAVACVSPIFHEQSPTELADWIRALGGDRLVLSSDLGQLASPFPPEGLRTLAAALLDLEVPYDELEKMTTVNPAWLAGLGPGWEPLED